MMRGITILNGNINGWWYLVGIGAFHGYPFPTRADAAEALEALQGVA